MLIGEIAIQNSNDGSKEWGGFLAASMCFLQFSCALSPYYIYHGCRLL